MMINFKIKGTGLDTSNLTYIPTTSIDEESADYTYFYTEVKSNNGLVVKPLFDSSTDIRLVTGVDFLDHASIAIRGHLAELSRSYVDVLLIDAGCDWYKYEEEIKALLDSGLVDEIGIKNPEKRTVDELEALRVKFNIKYIGINLCPIYYWKDLMDWANMVGLTIFSFNPLGGHISAPSLIDAFSLPYLLNFAALYSDVVFLSGKDIVFSNVNKDYLYSLLDTDIDDSIYRVKKDVNKLLKPMKEVGFTSVRIDEELFPITEKDTIFNPTEIEISLGTEKAKIDHTKEIEETDKVGQSILSFLEDVHLPEDTKDSKNYMSIVRPKAFALFRAQYPERDGWFNANVFIGDIYMFNAYKEKRSKRWFSPDEIKTESHTYILYYSKSTGFIFRNIQNSGSES